MIPSANAPVWIDLVLRVGLGVLCLVLAADFVWRVLGEPRTQRALWRAAFLGVSVLLGAELTGLAPFANAWTWPERRSPESVTATAPSRVEPAQPMSIGPTGRGGPRPSDPEGPPRPARTAGSESNTRSAPTQTLRTAWWPGLVWLVGTVVLGVRFVLGRFLLLVLTTRSSRRPSPATDARAQRVSRLLGFPRAPCLLSRPDLTAPAAFGVLRPRIALPADFEEAFSAVEQDAVLAHEMAHLAARDPAWNAFSDIVAAALWWHPAVWWARRRLRESSESAADDASRCAAGGAPALAGCLVRLGSRLRRAWLPGISAAHGGFRSGLGKRVERLLTSDSSTWRSSRPLRESAAALSGCIVLTVLAAMAVGWLPTGRLSTGGDDMKGLEHHWRRSVAGITFLALLSPAAESAGSEESDTARKPEASGAEVSEGNVVAFDDFDGEPSLRWDIRQPDPTHYSFTKRKGTLTITTQEGWSSFGFTNYKNLFLVDNPCPADQNFAVTTCLLGFKPEAAWHQAGVVCYDDDQNYIKFVYEFSDSGRPVFTVHRELRGQRTLEFLDAKPKYDKLWLRIRRDGPRYQFLTSTDGSSFKLQSKTAWGESPLRRVGLLARNGPSAQLDENAPEIDASFDSFEVRALGAAPKKPSAPPAERSDPPSKTGQAIELFNGKDLSGWKMLGNGKCVVEDGLLKVVGGTGEMAFLWYEKRKFKDFRLRVEYKVSATQDDSGVFVRFPPPESPGHLERNAYEIQIYDQWGDSLGTGAMIWRDGDFYDGSGPLETAAKAPGEWNLLEITVKGQEYSVQLNGKLTCELSGARGADGHIGLQNPPHENGMYFRSLRVEELK